MTIAMSSSNAFSHYLRYKLPLTGVKIVPYSGNVAQFLLDKNYAQQGYVFSEPFVARKEGGDPRVLMLSDLGFNPYTSLLFTHEDQCATNIPNWCARWWPPRCAAGRSTSSRRDETNRATSTG